MILVIILALVGFFYLNGRINNIERLLRGEMPLGTGPRVPSQPTVQPKPVAPVVEPVVVNPALQQSQMRSPVQPMPPMPPKTQESGEEFGGRLLGKIGIVAVLIGISFFLKYAFDNNLIGEIGRVIIGLVVGIGLLGLGQYLREKYTHYSDILMAGGIGVLYLTTYAAYGFYELISQPVAFAFLSLITLLSVIISIVDDTVAFSVLGILAGFLTPFLLWSSPDPVGLFTYILILDIGVLGVSLYKHWIQLNYLAFLGTIVVYGNWLGEYYRAFMLPIALGYATAFFVVFLIVTIAHHIRRLEKSGPGDILLATLNGVLYFAVAYILLDAKYSDILGFFALALAVVYLVIAFLAWSANPEDKALNFYLPGLATLFLTLAVPLQVSGYWITLAWLVEGLLLAIVASAAKLKSLHIFAIIIYIIGILKLMVDILAASSRAIAFFNNVFMVSLVAVAVAYILAYLYSRYKDDVMGTKATTIAVIFLVIAQFITVYSVTQQIGLAYRSKVQAVNLAAQREYESQAIYDGYGTSNYSSRGYYNESVYERQRSIINEQNTVISIFWTVYALILIGIGFVFNSKVFRVLGLGFFLLTAFKIFVDVWSLGEVYRIISSIVFGIVALIGSFAYARYRHKIQEIISQ